MQIIHLLLSSPFGLFSSGGDETQVALAIVLASSQDCGVYSCTINNEYGTDTTDFLLSIDGQIQNNFQCSQSSLYKSKCGFNIPLCFTVLSNILLKDDLEGMLIHQL